jgi:hypothetical protein
MMKGAQFAFLVETGEVSQPWCASWKWRAGRSDLSFCGFFCALGHDVVCAMISYGITGSQLEVAG